MDINKILISIGVLILLIIGGWYAGFLEKCSACERPFIEQKSK